ncbi:bolA-like protein 2 [Pollicipes pollicipes]|uniref:bolA-like protein 2 n=1 Tax=Pollicipes pollicipes TaxID=41117 RepID=UPI001884A6F8|nr:bolA-like protein 2 [Pollicipes pollicipes]
MPYTESYIKEKLTSGLEALHVEVLDESDGCGGKFSVVVVSKQFEGKPLLARHRLVNSLLSKELKEIHAFSQKTLTPDQWEQRRQQQEKQ